MLTRPGERTTTRSPAGASGGRRGLLVIVPAFNEEGALPGVLEELRTALPDADVLVVDDGSTDGTAAAAARGGAEVESFPQNRGLRAALPLAYARALSGGYALCGRVDADGQHPASELARLVGLVAAGGCDMAIGSRFLDDAGHHGTRYALPLGRRACTAMVRIALSLAIAQRVADPLTGMSVVNRRAMALLAEPFAGNAPEVEAIMRVRAAGLRLAEVPVDMRVRATGESKMTGLALLSVVPTVLVLLRGLAGRIRGPREARAPAAHERRAGG
jgi:hypothetical protein